MRCLQFTVVGLVMVSSLKSVALSTQDFWIPRADTLVPGEVKFDLREKFTLDKTGGSGYYNGLWGLSMGILHWQRFRLEAGLDWTEPVTVSLAAALSAHGRLVFNDVKEDGWAVAVGVDNFGFHAGVNDYNINHLVFENSIGDEWRMAFGGFAANSTYFGSEDKGMLAGVWKTIQNGRGVTGIELTSGNGALGAVVPGLKMEVRDGVFAYLGYGYANRRNVYKDWVLMRVSILF